MTHANNLNAKYMTLVEQSVAERIAGRLLPATVLATQAVQMMPDQPSGWHTLAMAESDSGRHENALRCRERAVELLRAMPSVPTELLQYAQQCLFGYATSLLLAGRWAEAWPLWESGRIGYSWTPPAGTVPWSPSDPADADTGLIVVCEGGYGDLFLFSRFLPALRRRAEFPGKICLFVWPGTKDVRDWGALGVDEVVELGQTYEAAKYKYSTSIMSLPGLLGFDRPAGVPGDWLLNALGDAMAPAPRRGRSLRIGVCWRSEENKSPRRIRSFDVDTASAICHQLSQSIRNACRLSLCPEGKSISGEKPFATPNWLGIEPTSMSSWRATIAYIASMDFVLTVDTAVAHLCGLIGVPTLCCLPLNVDWKWLAAGDTSVWYGPQFRLFRNSLPLSWEVDKIIAKATEIVRSL